jgi:FO synthase
MTPEEVLAVAEAGRKAGCKEALFSLGEKPEDVHPLARKHLEELGYSSMTDYLIAMCELVFQETGLLPHSNSGVLEREEVAALRDVTVSMGLMLENISPRLMERGQAHYGCMGKAPEVRMDTMRYAGQLNIPFTTGILIGIGETKLERIESLLAIRELHRHYGHVQEVIVQNFRAKQDTPMSEHLDPSTEDLLWTVAVSRLVLGPDVNIQVPPNLSYGDYPIYLLAGINDWGGISPLTIDYVNPEAPWPQISELRHRTEELGFRLRPRLPLYPEYIIENNEYMPASLAERIKSLADEEGYVKGGIERYASNTS